MKLPTGTWRQQKRRTILKWVHWLAPLQWLVACSSVKKSPTAVPHTLSIAWPTSHAAGQIIIRTEHSASDSWTTSTQKSLGINKHTRCSSQPQPGKQVGCPLSHWTKNKCFISLPAHWHMWLKLKVSKGSYCKWVFLCIEILHIPLKMELFDPMFSSVSRVLSVEQTMDNMHMSYLIKSILCIVSESLTTTETFFAHLCWASRSFLPAVVTYIQQLFPTQSAQRQRVYKWQWQQQLPWGSRGWSGV